MTSPLHGKSILVTGGTGTFGHAFVQTALESGASKVVVFSRGEAKQAAMKVVFPDERMRFVIGDVREAQRVMDACRGIDLVVHAAALKRIDSCDADPWEAAETNIQGTRHVARACIERGVEKAVFLSTDKSAAPTTTYGASKFFSERLWVQSNVYSAGTSTRFAATRYGNVLGSTGSVVTIFREQAKAGVITITDPNATRFWMTIGQAVDLVVLAFTDMRGGEVFIPRVPASTVGALAKAVAPNAQWRVIGLRANEKMHEMLVCADEAPHVHAGPGYYVIEPSSPLWESREPSTLPKVPEGFEFTSKNASQLTPEGVERLIAA